MKVFNVLLLFLHSSCIIESLEQSNNWLPIATANTGLHLKLISTCTINRQPPIISFAAPGCDFSYNQNVIVIPSELYK